MKKLCCWTVFLTVVLMAACAWAEPRSAVVETVVNLRTGRSTDTAVTGKLTPGEPFVVDHLLEGWYAVFPAGAESFDESEALGYASADYVVAMEHVASESDSGAEVEDSGAGEPESGDTGVDEQAMADDLKPVSEPMAEEPVTDEDRTMMEEAGVQAEEAAARQGEVTEAEVGEVDQAMSAVEEEAVAVELREMGETGEQAVSESGVASREGGLTDEEEADIQKSAAAIEEAAGQSEADSLEEPALQEPETVHIDETEAEPAAPQGVEEPVGEAGRDIEFSRPADDRDRLGYELLGVGEDAGSRTVLKASMHAATLPGQKRLETMARLVARTEEVPPEKARVWFYLTGMNVNGPPYADCTFGQSGEAEVSMDDEALAGTDWMQ